MRLILVRHAIAEDRDTFAVAGSNRPDNQRRLTGKGVKRMRRGANGLRRILRDEVDILASSPYLRAVETANLIARSFSRSIRPVVEQAAVLEPGRGPDAVTEWLGDIGSEKRVVLVGHEPDLSRLMAHLTIGSSQVYAGFGKGGACQIEFTAASAAGAGELVWFATPGILRRLGVCGDVFHD